MVKGRCEKQLTECRKVPSRPGVTVHSVQFLGKLFLAPIIPFWTPIPAIHTFAAFTAKRSISHQRTTDPEKIEAFVAQVLLCERMIGLRSG
jgi:hypothetical protein